jgi:hypothetical protein
MKYFRVRLVFFLVLGICALVACGDFELGWPDNIGGGGSGGGDAIAQTGGPEYSISFVCGANPSGSLSRVLPGQYATMVNIYNPSGATETVSLKVSFSLPPGGLEVGDISGFLNKNISSGRSIEVDCDSIQNDIYTGNISATFFTGYLLVDATVAMDVTATYTVGTVDAVASVNIQKIPSVR